MSTEEMEFSKVCLSQHNQDWRIFCESLLCHCDKVKIKIIKLGWPVCRSLYELCFKIITAVKKVVCGFLDYIYDTTIRLLLCAVCG